MSLIADAYHTKTDIWSSVTVLIGIIGAIFGYIHLDALAGSIVSIFISYGGYELLMESKKAINGEDPHMENFQNFFIVIMHY